jgi:dihydropteroate synthase
VFPQLERGFLEPIGRTRLMGIVNVTPDSFSDGGRFASTEAAIAHGLALLVEGADILDIGGESTRPGATRPLLDEELRRVVPVIRELAEAGAVVSVDTMRADVADAAVSAGARIVNDVSGGLADPRMLSVVAASEAAYVAMHWRAHSARMHDFAMYDGPGGVVAAVRDELSARLDAAVSAGIEVDRIVLDPGLGFAKDAGHNWALLGDLDVLRGLGQPLLVGSSRKRFLGELLADADGTPRPVDQREHANTALTVLLARAEVWGVRVHDVRASADALAVLDRLAGQPGSLLT